MSNKKTHELTGNLGRCHKVVLQSSAEGISAVEIAKKLGIHRTTVHGHLTSLRLMGLVESEQGVWRAKTGEQTIKPLEKEITIELPIPENQSQQIALLDAYAEHLDRMGYDFWAEDLKIILEKLRETRIIRIKGKNVDELDLEKIGSFIQQANEKSSKFNLKGLFKGLKRSQPRSKKTKHPA